MGRKHLHNLRSNRRIRKDNKMSELEIGKEVIVRTNKGWNFSIGIVTKVTPKWVHLEGTHRTPKSKWILRESIHSVDLFRSGGAVIISQMYDH
jgi:hypothetical protein